MATRPLTSVRIRALRNRAKIEAEPATARLALRVLVVAVALSLGVALAWMHVAKPPPSEGPQMDAELFALPDAGCRLRGSEAQTHARSLEALADGRWQRAPFALREAPRALREMADAEACYEAASDREGRRRTGSKRRQFEAELRRRFAQATLQLHACRHDHLRDGDPERCRVRAEDLIGTLLAEKQP